MTASFESFEPRRLFSVVLTPIAEITPRPTAKLSATGTLQITGTSKRDILTVARDEKTGFIKVTIGGPAVIDRRKADIIPDAGFDPRLVKRIKLDAGGGNDLITYTRTDAKVIPVTINTGKGNDTITAEGRGMILSGGSGDDTITSQQHGAFRYTQAERDLFTIFANGSDTGTVRPSVVIDGKVVTKEEAFSLAIKASGNLLDGGDGNDTFNTYGGEDSLVGGAGTDHYHADFRGIQVFADADLADQPVTKAARKSIRSRLAVSGVEDIVTISTGSPMYEQANTLDDLR